ncbi:DUF58 domain-containing protein [Agromyces protaetiae]|uniref:DUF58 domain-containing protein n=1 Tax=Agromyces protaetiae TaxID=2509455 RepID=A0A4P6FCQ1_9MICO|nr:DUF58 domain-containing protein [Agromyces protaetiae]QAY72129.1 DUF58 domain-containing protein [Agromyces protaetiae]
MTFHTESRLTRTAAGTGTRTRGGTVTRVSGMRRGPVAGFVRGIRMSLLRTRLALRAAVRWYRETVSSAGTLLVCVAVVGVVAGLSFGWMEAWAAAAVAVALLVVCVPFLLGTHDYALGLAIDRDRVVAGTEVGARLDLANSGRRTALPGVVDIPVGAGLVEVHVPLLRPGAQHGQQLAIGAERRGVIDIGPMTISRGDPIGILRREQRWPEVRRIHVHPVTVAIPPTSAGLVRDLEGAPTGTLVVDDLSFHGVREYLRGDSQRHVHWKATARTGKMMVRQYEESRHARIAVLLDVDRAEFEHDDEFETAVSAAASLGVQGVREGRDVYVGVGGTLPEFSGSERVESLRTLPSLTPRVLLDSMSGVESDERVTRLETAASLAAQTFDQLSVVFLVTGSKLPLQRLRQAAVALPPGVAAVAVRCELGAEPSLRSTRELTVLTIGVLGDLTRMLARGVLS